MCITDKNFWDFEIQMDPQIAAKRPHLVTDKKTRTCQLVDLAVPTDHKVKIRRIDRQIVLSCQWVEKLCNMKVTVIPIVVGALGMVPKT